MPSTQAAGAFLLLEAGRGEEVILGLTLSKSMIQGANRGISCKGEQYGCVKESRGLPLITPNSGESFTSKPLWFMGATFRCLPKLCLSAGFCDCRDAMAIGL